MGGVSADLDDRQAPAGGVGEDGEVLGVAGQDLVAVRSDIDYRGVNDVNGRGGTEQFADPAPRRLIERPFIDASEQPNEMDLPSAVAPGLGNRTR